MEFKYEIKNREKKESFVLNSLLQRGGAIL